MPNERDTAKLAREAAARIDQDMDRGQQLGLLPELEEPQLPAARKAGRPEGAKNKGSSQLREWMAARGMRMPEEVIAEMAGLNARGKDAFNFALSQAERLLAHVGETAENRVFIAGKGHVILDSPWQPSPAEFLDTFKFFYGMARQAASDLMPYGTPKASPDGPGPVVIPIVGVPMAPGYAPQPRDVTPRPGGRMVPADVALEREQNQGVSGEDPEHSDGEDRTE
jgi:hypothetical protein